MANFGVSQNTEVGKGWIKSLPSIAGNDFYTAKRMINFHVSEVGEDLVFEGTRLTIASRGKENDVYPLTCGTEVVVRYMITYYDEENGDWVPVHQYFTSREYVDAKMPLMVVSTIDLMRKLSCFHNHPLYNVQVTNDEGSSGANNYSEITDPIGNLDVWTAMSYHDLQKLNDTATLSLFYTPLVARAKAY